MAGTEYFLGSSDKSQLACFLGSNQPSSSSVRHCLVLLHFFLALRFQTIISDISSTSEESGAGAEIIWIWYQIKLISLSCLTHAASGNSAPLGRLKPVEESKKAIPVPHQSSLPNAALAVFRLPVPNQSVALNNQFPVGVALWVMSGCYNQSWAKLLVGRLTGRSSNVMAVVASFPGGWALL